MALSTMRIAFIECPQSGHFLIGDVYATDLSPIDSFGVTVSILEPHVTPAKSQGQRFPTRMNF
jgi:hypothetical protein